MALDSKVVWSEGTFLCPQHFQQFDRYIDTSFAQAVKFQTGYYWGFKDLEIDEASLLTGKIRVNRASGVFPDGTVFTLNEKIIDGLTLSVSKTIRDTRVVLALPVQSTTQNEVQFPDEKHDSRKPRYQGFEQTLYDTTNIDAQTREVLLAHINPILMFEDELTEAYTYLPITVVEECRNDIHVILDKSYIPPTLNCQNQEQLKGYITEVKGLLEQRASALADHLANPNYGGVAEVRDFLMLEVVNRYTAYLLHENEGALQTHPETLFVNLSKLCADLSTYMPDKRPIGLPVYDHNDLQLCYPRLLDYLRRALSLIIEQRAIRLDLELRDEATRVAQTPSPDLLGQAAFVLAIRSDIPTETLRQRIPSVIKISTVEKIRELVSFHLPGVQVQALSVAPRELPYHAGYSYFELDKQTELWSLFDSSSGMAIHLAGEFPGLDVEFWAIKP